ncbi:MAG: hypothetical protein HY748_00935 [Elusimicrobia bacterium]|nr:hypothetical protein [Elusimicrobiota bacterium]
MAASHSPQRTRPLSRKPCLLLAYCVASSRRRWPARMAWTFSNTRGLTRGVCRPGNSWPLLPFVMIPM